MSDNLESILYKVASVTLEQLAFLFSSFEDIQCKPDYDTVVVASVSFSGQFSGTLSIMIVDDILDELTENMLGIDGADEVPIDQKHDALKETINIVCGNLLPAIGGKRSLFSIGSPIIILDNEAKKKAVNNENTQKRWTVARLSIDDNSCGFFLLIDEDAKLEPELSDF